MPSLREDMYCSEEISIPPTFPYLLRQFAKAAIRSQPTDLLRWAAAYFRCLSLNIPPPVKPRLEYPVPKGFKGLTPGWLKALLHSFSGYSHLHFKQLWERWIGACLDHDELVKILCLANFQDNTKVPLYRFIAVCCGFLTNNLTDTMVLICNVLTEEPEGGSAMITKEIFIDLYQFLAKIEASRGQTLKNYFFRISFLDLFEEKKKKEEAPPPPEEIVEEEVIEESSVEEEVKVDVCKKIIDDGSIISCPSVDSLVPATAMDYAADSDAIQAKLKMHKEAEEMGGEGQYDMEFIGELGDQREIEGERVVEPVKIEVQPAHDETTDRVLKEDLERLKAIQETPGEGFDWGLEKFKAGMVEKPEGVEVEEEEEEEKLECDYDPVWCEAVPGIGPEIEDTLIQVVIKYMDDCAECQEGMVMPRNIHHPLCPTLESYDDHRVNICI